MSNRYAAFIQANRELWTEFPTVGEANGLLLVEPQPHPMISHANAVFARIIGEARGLAIGWLDNGDPEIQKRLLSYDPNSRTISSRAPATTMGLTFLRSAVEILRTKDILGFSLGALRFGDILYDSCLAHFQLATIAKVDSRVLRTLWGLIANHHRFRSAIRASRASAVLVSHEVGLSSGVLMRTALALGLTVYHRRSEVQLNVKTSLSDIYVNASRPRMVDMEVLASSGEERLEREFQELIEDRMRHGDDVDAGRAYAREKRVYRSKEEFGSEFKVPADVPFVFIMLHAFNDHPHSHFGRMLFKDYYDWFAETLKFAESKEDVAWIFKEHPSAAYYPTRDICLADHFKERSPHVVFLDAGASFSSESLLYCADVVVTVAGTAGVEFAAAGGIPSILAGSTEYSGFGFTLEPETPAEYFELLRRIERVPRLTPEQRSQARRVFLYMQRYAVVPFSWCPTASFEEEKDLGLDAYYWARIPEVYEKGKEKLVAEFRGYVEQIRDPGFSRLTRLS